MKTMRRLDPAQVAAATGQASIQLTLAGPGSGKTSTLTGRFVHLVRQGVDPRRILAVTFTKKAADEMRRRIARLLQLPSPSSLHVMTFHAFTFRLLKKNPGVAGLPDRFQLWDIAEQRHVFNSRRMWWNEDKDILDIIGGAKERLLDADGFEAEIDRDDEMLVEAVKYFQVYQQALRDACAIDFADMVPLVVKAMIENDRYRCSITSAYDHLLVDEYQDVNPGQVGLIDHFVNDGVKLWAVGDDDQTLYAFRASDVRYILEFSKKYPGAMIHLLNRNYRSCPDIAMAARRLIRHNKIRHDKDCQPALTEPGEMVIRGYSSPDIEARQIGRSIAELIRRGCAAQEIGVLYRTGAVGLPLQAVLKEMAIPFEVRGGADIWQSVAAKLVVGSLYYLRDGDGVQAMSRLGTNKRGQILRQKLDPIRSAMRHRFAASCQNVQRIVAEAVPGQSPDREKAEWRAMVDAVVAVALTSASIEEMEANGVEQSRSLRKLSHDGVVLSTIHSAKGLEWDTVFLAGMEDGVLPHHNAEDTEEERRVAYVGLTRARRRLGLTYAAERYGERSKPSPFLFEIAGAKRCSCLWTGVKLPGADDRLPLLTSDENHLLAQREGAAEFRRPNHNRKSAAINTGNAPRKPRRKAQGSSH
jgi:DNA helicase II / ATP-dependent DNA helicase PcrA